MNDEFKDYTMGFQVLELPKARLESFLRQELTANEIVVLMQDILEAGTLTQLPPQFYHCAVHLVSAHLISLSGRATH